ncbi:MAG TPA: DNA polymerase IV [Gemmatimonadaceae bacterium]
MSRILLADADAFFVAVARMVDPEGAGQAELLIVGGSRESRGVVCSASYETRRFGVRSAMPIAQALRLCPRAMCVPVPRAACAAKSREIRHVLQRFTPVVEGASIDEWYLDLGGTEELYKGEPLEQTAHRIRDAVRAETGLTVSIGGGVNKLVAKLAVELAKPKPTNDATGVHIVPPGGEETFMLRFALADIPLIGPKFQERLHRVGLRTVAHVLEQDLASLVRWFGEREGRWLYDRVRGIDRTRVEPREEPKSISREDTFPTDVADDATLERELLRLVMRAAGDLRHDGLTARTITVKLRDADFTTRQASRTLPEGVVADRVIHDTARALLRKLRAARRCPARLLGVALSSLAADPEPAQLALFDQGSASPETPRDRALARTVDELRERFGPDAIVPGQLASRDKRRR